MSRNLEMVVNYFLSKQSMTPKKLQKIVYYAYAWCMALLSNMAEGEIFYLFEEKFEAWVHGPVCPELYQEYKCYGWGDIDVGHQNLDFKFEPDVEDILKQVWEIYGGYNANQLETITHQEKPWLEARDGFSPSDICKNQIKEDVIYDYYNSL